MNRKSIVSKLLVIILVCGTFLGTITYFNHQIELRDAKLCLATETITNYEQEMADFKKLKKEYQALQTEHSSLSSKIESISQEKDKLMLTYQELVAEFVALKKQSQEFESRLLQMDDLMEKYDYVFDYDPVLLEECQVYIQELEEKLLASGGFDKFDAPKRKREYEDVTIWLEDGASVKWADEAMTYLSMLPKKLLKEIQDLGWMFVITPRSLENVYESQVTNTVGLTIYYQKRIYIQNDSFSIEYCSIHEIGHAVDFLHNFLSYDSEWKLIYEEEARNSGLGEYFISSGTEYFAQTFQAFYLEPEIVKVRAPKSYAYIEALMSDYQ